MIFPFAFIVAVFIIAKDLKWKDLKQGKLSAKEKMSVRENVKIQHFDSDGNIKKLFKHNFIGELFLKRGFDYRGFLMGSSVDHLEFSNLVVDAAFPDVAGLINGSTAPASYDFIGMGTGSTAAAAGNTALETEINNDGNPTFTNRGGAGAASRVTTTITNDTAQVITTFTIGAFTPAVTELGLLNSNTTGTLFARQVFAVVNLVVSDNFQVTWKIAVSTP